MITNFYYVNFITHGNIRKYVNKHEYSDNFINGGLPLVVDKKVDCRNNIIND